MNSAQTSSIVWFSLSLRLRIQEAVGFGSPHFLPACGLGETLVSISFSERLKETGHLVIGSEWEDVCVKRLSLSCNFKCHSVV